MWVGGGSPLTECWGIINDSFSATFSLFDPMVTFEMQNICEVHVLPSPYGIIGKIVLLIYSRVVEVVL